MLCQFTVIRRERNEGICHVSESQICLFLDSFQYSSATFFDPIQLCMTLCIGHVFVVPLLKNAEVILL